MTGAPSLKTGEAPVTATIPTSLLLVDDQPKNLLALEAILEPLGVELVKAHSGQEALKHLLTREFAAILLDVQMPGLDGFETATLVKERERSRHIPIIFLTAISKEDAFVFRGYTVGAVDYIFKPFDPDILRSKVQVFIDLYRKTEELKIKEKLLKEREIGELRRTSERRYRELAESMPQIVWMADGDGALVYGNRRWFDGVDVLSFSALVHPDDLVTFEQSWKVAREALGTTPSPPAVAWEAGEVRLKTSRGWRWHLVRAVPTSDALLRLAETTRRQSSPPAVPAPVEAWVGTCTDIDDRKRAEDALQLLADASTALGSTVDFAKAFGEVARMAVGKACDAIVIDRVHPKTGELETLVAEGEKPSLHAPAGVITTQTAQLVARVDDAELAPAKSLVSAPLVTRSGTFGAVTMVSTSAARRFDPADLETLQDLARRMSAAVEIADLYETVDAERAKLEQAHKAKDEFLATLSHELRTPLNAMLGWTQLLRSGDLEGSDQDRALETIERNAKAQAQLIADLLDVSRIVTGKLHLNMGRVHLPQLVEAAIDAIRLTADTKEIQLESSIDPFVRDASGDSTRLTQVISNLLSNAIKFTPAGGSVKVTLAGEDDVAKITVSDTGQGISADFLPHVFERFRQADSTSTRSQGGLGLGLAIVRHLVELHGGSVMVGSEGKDKGSSFVVTLPLLASPSPAEHGNSARGGGDGGGGKGDGDGDGDGDTGATRASRETPTPETARELAGIHVVLVEDEPDGRGMARVVLERSGASVTAVPSAAAALEALAERTPHVLISDIGLPDEDGYALIRKVRAMPPAAGGGVLAIALTAYASEQDRQRALRSGFDAHLSKPVEAGELRALVVRLTRGGVTAA